MNLIKNSGIIHSRMQLIPHSFLRSRSSNSNSHSSCLQSCCRRWPGRSLDIREKMILQKHTGPIICCSNAWFWRWVPFFTELEATLSMLFLYGWYPWTSSSSDRQCEIYPQDGFNLKEEAEQRYPALAQARRCLEEPLPPMSGFWVNCFEQRKPMTAYYATIHRTYEFNI